MTSVEIPYSIACALPTLTALDITNEVAHEVDAGGPADGIAFVSPASELGVVRVTERESGFFSDVEALLARVVGPDEPERERLLAALLGPRTEQIPFAANRLCLGQWQRILLVTFGDACHDEWTLTLVG